MRTFCPFLPPQTIRSDHCLVQQKKKECQNKTVLNKQHLRFSVAKTGNERFGNNFIGKKSPNVFFWHLETIQYTYRKTNRVFELALIGCLSLGPFRFGVLFRVLFVITQSTSYQQTWETEQIPVKWMWKKGIIYPFTKMETNQKSYNILAMVLKAWKCCPKSASSCITLKHGSPTFVLRLLNCFKARCDCPSKTWGTTDRGVAKAKVEKRC